ncbi:MAG TPA: hypothetical protein VD969_07500 [Symbiobacteriaceae bacterium]|nr:hypothetical protein [Symbiobacteriaceae bacterium]
MKKLLWVLAGFGLICLIGSVAAGVFLAVKTLRPELLDSGLQEEMGALGVTVGTSTEVELIARFGEPQQRKQETLSTVYLYHSKGLLFRVDKQTGKLLWYEVTSSEYATARGIRLGATYDQILDAYGATNYVALLPTGTRLRYKYGTAFFLEFWLNKAGRLDRFAFYHS